MLKYDVKWLYSFHDDCGFLTSHGFYMNVHVAALPVLLVVFYASITIFLLCVNCAYVHKSHGNAFSFMCCLSFCHVLFMWW